ncbi:MAG: NmrA family NAD(P)-binding protein [Microlunatus sp.]
MNSTILVTAATGNVGRQLVPQLLSRGATVRAYDRSRPIASQLSDVDAVFLACPNIAEQVAYECAIADAAAAAGVSRIVKLSARGAAHGSRVAFWDWHAQIEQHLAGLGVPVVALRPGFSMANLLGSLDTAREHGVLPLPVGEARVAMVDPIDVAACATAALLDDLPPGCYEPTGPAAIGFAEVAAALTAVIGHQVHFVDVPPEQAASAMIASGLPAFAAEQICNVFAELRAGAQAEVTTAVQQLTGAGPGSLVRFLARI